MQALDHRGSLQGKRLLLLEDERDLREMVAELLREEDIEVTAVGEAAEAIEWLRSDAHYDVLFADVIVPGALDGIEVAKRAVELQPGIGILLTSGNPVDVERRLIARGLEFTVLGKPYDDTQLFRMLGQL